MAAPNVLPHVFVVMPFGSKEVPKDALKEPRVEITAELLASKEIIKVNFDDVYQMLLAPALRNAACEPFRATDEKGAGDIRMDMFFELVTADWVLADISILNANVFYELGVRHGIGPRGVIAVHGGWAARPFDVVTDRTFSYNGQLFLPGLTRDAAWEQLVRKEVEQLAEALRGAMLKDRETIGSPVYSYVTGLKPADWSGIETPRANYLKSLADEWQKRVKIARRERHPEDILTLARDMPTRLHRVQLLWQCARALVELHRFQAARGVLGDLLRRDPENFEAKCYVALVENRLGLSTHAEANLDALVAQRPGDGEAQGMLGRVYKDLWRVAWETGETLEERKELARDHAVIAVKAIRSYERAFRRDLGNYYNGINVVTLQALLDDLFGQEGAETEMKDLPDLKSVVSVAAREDLKDPGKAAWAEPTLGELELVRGKGPAALSHYRRAANAPNVTYFEIDSMLGQIRLLEGLGFQAQEVTPIVELLKKKLATIGGPLPSFSKVVVCSGHMIDAPTRKTPRFPATKENAVRENIAKQLAEWGIGSGALAICGGACGSDILFAEECRKLGATVRLRLALPRGQFVQESVAFAGHKWVERLEKLEQSCEVAEQTARLSTPPEGTDVFSRCNLWILNSGRVELGPQSHLYSLLIWDEKPTGDGPGGTSDFARRVDELGGEIAIINPTKIAESSPA